MNRSLVSFLLVAAFAMPAAADVLFVQTPGELGITFTDLDGGFFTTHDADDFILQPGATTITSIQWWGAYAFANTPQETDYFTILIWEDDGGSPQSVPVYNLTTSDVNRTNTGLLASDTYDLYAYSVDIAPLTLTAGKTYWLSIINDTTEDQDDTWAWAIHAQTGGIYRFGFSTDGTDGPWSNGLSLAFQLTGVATTVVPEPATMSLLGLGLMSIALRRRLRSLRP